MFKDIYIYHHKGHGDVFAKDKDILQWQTCVRSLIFSPKPLHKFSDSNDIESFAGSDAYRFCLEVVCGYHSPIFGETEIFGQFKLFVEHMQQPKNHWENELIQFLNSINEKAKQMRAKYLQNLGSRSYGSQLRRLSENHTEVHVVGSGHLAESVIPWLSSKDKIFVYARSPERVRQKLESVSNGGARLRLLPLQELGSRPNTHFLLVAAPVSNDLLQEKLERVHLKLLVDLRKDSPICKLPGQPQTMNLHDFFDSINADDHKVNVLRTKLETAINNETCKWVSRRQNRPFGWEDLCG